MVYTKDMPTILDGSEYRCLIHEESISRAGFPADLEVLLVVSAHGCG